MVRIGGVKQYADGSISERTAWLAEPYVGIADFSGVELGTRESLYDNSRKAWLAGFQLATHANGERAIDRIVGIYEQLQRESPRRDPRFRIEHCTVVTPELVARIRAVEAIPIPFAGYVNFHGDVLHFYGEERTKRMFAYRSFIDAGLKPPSSSDYTASPPAPDALAVFGDHAPRSFGSRVGRKSAHHRARSAALDDPQRRLCVIRRT